MGRSIVYCPICGCPFEDVLENSSSEGAYDSNISPQSQTKVRKDRPCSDISVYLPPQVPRKLSCNRQKHIHVCSSSTSPLSSSFPATVLGKTHLILCYFNQDMRRKPPRHHSESHLLPATPNSAPASSKAEIHTVLSSHAQEGKNGCY